jgi:hypothetical protein
MDCFKYPFRGNSFIWILFIFILLIAINCQNGCGCNGCTTSVVVDKESRKLKEDGVPIKVTVNKNRVTNRKLRLNNDKLIDKTIWYSVDYYLRVEKRPEIKNICETEVPENADLEKALADFNVKFSPDKKHFAVGLNDNVYDFFHLLKEGVPFSSGCYYLRDSNDIFLSTADIHFNEINWNIFPTPDALFDTIIVPNKYAVWAPECNKNNILKLLYDMPPGNSHDMVLIENWFCEVADLHFTEQRVNEIIKVSPKWKKTAIEKIIQSIDNSVSANDPELDKSQNMLLWINDASSLHKVDSMVFDEYFAAAYAGDYLIKRMKNTNIRLDKKIHSALLNKAKSISSNFQESTEEMSEKNAIDILLICKEYELLKTFMRKNIRPEIIINDYTDVSNVTIRKFELYPKDLQAQMISAYLEIAKNTDLELSNFDISEIVEFLKDKISCDELKKLAELHKDQLIGFIMPKGC